MRYTKYHEVLGRYVVPCSFRADGKQIEFMFKLEVEERTTDGQFLVSPQIPLVFGEAIDRLAELENQKEAVRCKDCQSYGDAGKCRDCNLWRDPDDFCSRGRRREADNNAT